MQNALSQNCLVLLLLLLLVAGCTSSTQINVGEYVEIENTESKEGEENPSDTRATVEESDVREENSEEESTEDEESDDEQTSDEESTSNQFTTIEQDVDEIEEKIDDLEKDIEDAEDLDELSDIEEEINDLLEELEKAEDKLDDAKDSIDQDVFEDLEEAIDDFRLDLERLEDQRKEKEDLLLLAINNTTQETHTNCLYVADIGMEYDLNQCNNYDSIKFFQYTIYHDSLKITFTNNDGTEVEIPLSGNPSYVSGEGSAEPMVWGVEAPSSTNSGIDELLFLEGESCVAVSTIVDCQGASFLVIDADNNAHVIQITNIDTNDNQINFDDITYGTSNDDVVYSENSVTTIILTNAGEIQILVDETTKTITFTDIGSNNGANILTSSGAVLKIINDDLTTQIFEGLLFSEYDDGVLDADKYIDELEIEVLFDDVNGQQAKITEPELSSTIVTPLEEEYMLFYITAKGSLITYNTATGWELTIQHPEESLCSCS